MRELLLRLLGAPRPTVIEIDDSAIAIAKPGDTVVVLFEGLFTPEKRAAIVRFRDEELPRSCPGVKFVFMEGAVGAAVIKRVIE